MTAILYFTALVFAVVGLLSNSEAISLFAGIVGVVALCTWNARKAR